MPAFRRADARYASDLERAVVGFERATSTLATHPGTLPARLSAAASDVAGACPWNRSPRLPRDLPDGMRPPQDLPDDLAERMRVLLNTLAGEWLHEDQAVHAALEVIALADELSAADNYLRRTRATLVLALTTEELQRQPTDAELLRSGIWSEEHLITLGRIVEESAGNEATVRQMLGLALRLPDGSSATQRYAEVVFLGARVRDLAGKLRALVPLDGAPPWLQEAVSWADTAAKADEQRNQLLHRPPAFIDTAVGLQPGMSPARRSQSPEILAAQAINVLRELGAVSRAGTLLLARITANEASPD